MVKTYLKLVTSSWFLSLLSARQVKPMVR